MTQPSRVALVWAQARDGVIGAGNAIPWRIPADMARFKALTLGHPVIMGRRTWDSLPASVRPLPGRRNIVLTRQPAWSAPGAERAGNLDDALTLAGPGPVSVIGGAEIYCTAMPVADTLHVTEIDLDVLGDAHAPRIDATWRLADDGPWQLSGTTHYRFRRYERA